MTQREYEASYKRLLYDARKHNGVCVSCGAVDAFTLNGRAECAECCEKRRQRRNYQEKADYQRAIYKARKAAGICVRCNKKAIPGMVHCEQHRIRHNQKVRALKAHNHGETNWPRGDNGYCYVCNKRPTMDNLKVCDTCYKKLELARANKKTKTQCGVKL